MSGATVLREKAEAIAEAAPLVEAPRRLSVQEAISCVMRDLPSIGKDERYPGAENYQYRGIETVARHVQPLLAKYGLVIVPRALIRKVEPSPAMKDGWQDVHIEVAWTLMGPDGSSLIAQTTGIGRDRSDKGANKAQTQAFKYLLLHLFCIADGKDDADGHVYENDREDAVLLLDKDAAKDVVKLLAEGDPDRAKAAWTDIALTATWTTEGLTAAYETWSNTPPDEPVPSVDPVEETTG